MQPSEPHEHRDRDEPRIVGIPQTAPDLRALATCIADLRVRRRRLKDELAITDELLTEARRQAGSAGGLGGRRRTRARAVAQCIAQLARRRDFLSEELAASEIDIDFEIPAAARQAYAELCKRFDALRQCAGMTNIRQSVAAGRHRSARGNTSLGERPALFPATREFAPFVSEFPPPHLRNGAGDELLFFPCFLAVLKANDRIALVDIRQVQVSIPGYRLDGDRSLIATADDRMLSRQPQAGASVRPTNGHAIVGNGQLVITSKAGLAEAFDIRDAAACRAFAQALANYVATLPASGGAFASPETPEPLEPLEIPALPQLPPPLHHNPWPVLVAGALVAATLIAWRADLLPTADRLATFTSDLRGAAGQARDLVAGLLHREVASTPGDEGSDIRETTEQGEAAAPEPELASAHGPTSAMAPAGGELAPAAGTVEEQSAASTGAAAPPPFPGTEAGPAPTEPSAPTPATSPLTRAEVKALQAKLQELGFQPGPADGVAGRRTMRAVKAFQRAHGLGATGIIDRQILKAVLDAPARQTSHATSATEAVADAPKAVPGLASDRDDDLLTASERGR